PTQPTPAGPPAPRYRRSPGYHAIFPPSRPPPGSACRASGATGQAPGRSGSPTSAAPVAFTPAPAGAAISGEGVDCGRHLPPTPGLPTASAVPAAYTPAPAVSTPAPSRPSPSFRATVASSSRRGLSPSERAASASIAT